ncbi:MAG: transcriptional activator RfaH [Loktanella sp.]|nr:transcriptional activator RfaH [Loktanella sp.]
MTHNDQKSAWFLAQLKPNSHNIAERNLIRQGFRTFLPMHEETIRAQGKFKTRMRPLFPGYLFVALDLHDGNWRAVNSTYGITQLVSLSKTPTPVPNDLVAQIKRRCDQDGKLRPSDPFKEGDAVMLTKGPFANLVATIESIAPDRRIYVLMDLMGAQTRVAVREEHLRVQA